MPRELNKQSYVFQLPGGEVINDYYLAPELQQFLSQVRPDKSSPTGDSHRP